MNIQTVITNGTDIDELHDRTARLDAEREEVYALAREIVSWGIQRDLLKRPSPKKQKEDAGDE